MLVLLWMLCLTVIGYSRVEAQEVLHDTLNATPPSLGATPQRETPIFSRENLRIFLPVFRDYSLDREVQEQRIAVQNMIMINLRMETLGAEFRQRMNEEALIRSNMGISLPHSVRKGTSVWEALGTLVLGIAAEYAASYVRESLINRRNDEIDYLYLPRAPGVIRTFAETQEVAFTRGELQAMEIWYDYYWSLKNRPPEKVRQCGP